MKKDIQTKERFIELRAMGWSYDRISKELKTSRTTLIEWAKKYRFELANARAAAQDSLLDAFQLQREERVKFLGAEFVKAREELKGRDLKDMSTDKLLDYSLKLLAAVKTDTAPHTEFSGERNLLELDDSFTMDETKWVG